MLWADGRISWVQSDKVQEQLKKGEIYEQHPVAINELGQKRTELVHMVKDTQVLDNATVKR